MKICRYKFENKIHWGLLIEELIYPFNDLSFVNKNLENLNLSNPVNTNETMFLPPATPSKIVCVGRNYADHASELGNAVPPEPLLFLKAPSSLITHREKILIPEQSNQVEHEGELAVIIKRDCKNLSDDEDLSDFILGFTCLNDVTARDLQKKDVQFTRAKSFDTFCPIGNFIETNADVSDIRITTKVNGEIKQDGRTSQMVFPVPFLIRYISRQMTLIAGDIIATGTPAGVSKLQHDDRCEIEIENIGRLTSLVQ